MSWPLLPAGAWLASSFCRAMERTISFPTSPEHCKLLLIYLKTREHLELNLNENVHVTLINSDRPIFDPTAGVARIRFCSEHLF
jgi:hypothetical protein